MKEFNKRYIIFKALSMTHKTDFTIYSDRFSALFVPGNCNVLLLSSIFKLRSGTQVI